MIDNAEQTPSESDVTEFAQDNQSLRILGVPGAVIFLYVLATAPILQHLAVLGYAVEAWIFVGHWPSGNNPDPKALGLWWQHFALTLGFLGTLLGPLLATIISLTMWRYQELTFPWRFILVGIVCFVASITYGRLDPFGVNNWFWD